MKTKKAVIVLLSLPLMLCTLGFCSGQKPNTDISEPDRRDIAELERVLHDFFSSKSNEAASESVPTYTHYDRPQSPGAGITFPVVEGLSAPEGPLEMRSSSGVLEHLVKLSQKSDKEYPSDIFARSRLPAEMVNYGYHSFFDGIYHAYLEHRPVVLSPDAVWLLISQGFAQHVNANAEKLRRYFVDFDAN
jgi:hypothetical protein